MKELNRTNQSIFPVYLVFSFYKEITLGRKRKELQREKYPVMKPGALCSGSFGSQGSAGPVMRAAD